MNTAATHQMLRYLISGVGESVRKIPVLKLVYLADRYHLRKYGRSISHSKYFAMNKGPVPFETRNEMEQIGNGWTHAEGISASLDCGHNVFTATKPTEAEMDQLSDTDREAMDAALGVAKIHGVGEELVNYTHAFPEWSRHEGALNKSDLDSSVPMDIADFFLAAPREKEYCEADAELVALNKEAYEEWPQ